MPTSEKFKWRTLLRILLLFITLSTASYFLISSQYIYGVMVLAIIACQLTDLYKSQLKLHQEFNQFIESIRYRDFSMHFNVTNAPAELRHLRSGFNEINAMFKAISKEKETQYYYLQKTLELVNTGILSYDTGSGEVMWMNESLKKMLAVPYLKTIHAFSSRDENLYNEIITLKPGESKIGTAHAENKAYKVLLSATAFQTDGKNFIFIAFQNINEALEETETKAWQKLLSVLTHEIMNSIAPISSLAETIKYRLTTIDISSNSTTTLDDLQLGIDTIKRRSDGLLKFAETYRNLNKISKPVVQQLYVRNLFENLYQLMQPTLTQKNIELEIILKDPNLIVEADSNLIEQVLINLLVNAMEAVKEITLPKIALSADTLDNGKVVIKVADNGNGIGEELLDKIFIPFFSTKKNGSGIGLTLCKQIMMLHRGSIQVQSTKNEGTGFLLYF